MDLNSIPFFVFITTLFFNSAKFSFNSLYNHQLFHMGNLPVYRSIPDLASSKLTPVFSFNED